MKNNVIKTDRVSRRSFLRMAGGTLALSSLSGWGPVVKAQTPITIGYSDWTGWVAWQVPLEMGFFAARGVDVKLIWFPIYGDSLTALSASRVDGNSQTWSDTMAPVAQGVRQKLILVNDNSAGNDKVMVRPGVTSLADLEGKTIAMELFSISHFFFLFMLEQQTGLTAADVNLVNLSVGNAAAAFIGGSVDAAVVWEPWGSRIEASGEGKTLLTSREVPGLIPDALVVQEDLISARREDLLNVLRAWFDGLQVIQDDPVQAAEIMARRVEVDPETYIGFFDGLKFFSIADNLNAFEQRADLQSLFGSGEVIVDFLLQNDLLSRVPDIGSALDRSFIDELAAEL